MKMMYPMITAFSKDLVSLVDELLSNDAGIDVKNVCARFTADVIGACGFGLECNAMKDESSEMLKMGEFFDIRDFKVRANFFFVNVFPRHRKTVEDESDAGFH